MPRSPYLATMLQALRRVGWARGAGASVKGASMACLAVTLACGSRTGLDDFAGPSDRPDAESTSLAPDADPQALSCARSPALYNLTSLEAGRGCSAGTQLFDCAVAASGADTLDSFCVSDDPTCPVASNPSCEAQCGSNEYGILCAEYSSPMASGCRVLWPSPSNGPSGLAFCCACG